MKGRVVAGPDHAAGGLGHRLPSPRQEPGTGCHPPAAPGPDPRGSSGGRAGRVPSPEEMEEEAIAGPPGTRWRTWTSCLGWNWSICWTPSNRTGPWSPGSARPGGGEDCALHLALGPPVLGRSPCAQESAFFPEAQAPAGHAQDFFKLTNDSQGTCVPER
uniref:Uncharacterized protein n=1 Tax=Myotis myotis TaxID=51298 RepID=A0A7J7RV51_MYOMY|nr:hypothetical protein mMyoMyo1_010136 [Myotis myotis]